jgi:hypothetical protein
MTRRPLGLAAALALAVLAAACDQAPPSAPQDTPSFVKTPPPFACTFTGNPSLSNASNAYFTKAADQKTASDFIAAMQTAFGTTKNYAAARSAGFDLLSFVGKVSRIGGGSSTSAGAVVVQQAVQCMFDVAGADASLFSGWPTSTQFDFASALDKANGGVLYVRTPANPAAPFIVAANGAGNVAGFAPPANGTWSILSNQVLIYGNTVTGGYDWKLIPNTTTFSPFVVVALCQADNVTDMVHQEGVGVIGYQGARAATICAATQSEALLQRGPLGRLAEFAGRLFVPTTLQAAMVGTRVIGGSATSAKSDQFVSIEVPAVTLTVASQPINVKVNTRFSLTINVKTPAPDNEPAGGITVGLTAATNNGTGTGIFQIAAGTPDPIVCDPSVSSYLSVPSATTTPTVALPGQSAGPTNAVWNNNLCFSKTGSVYIIGKSAADGNETQGIGQVSSAKINVKP